MTLKVVAWDDTIIIETPVDDLNDFIEAASYEDEIGHQYSIQST